MRRLAILAVVLTCPALISADTEQLEPLEPWRDWPVRQIAAEAPLTEVVTLREVWRLDCGEDSEHLVGRITAAAPGPEGSVLLIDRQLTQVMVVAPDGSVARVLGRRGQGPDELSGIHRAIALADGRIGLTNGVAAPAFLIGGRGELVLLDQAGDPAGLWHLAGQPGDIPVCMVRDLRSARSELLVASMRTLIAADLTMTGVQELSLVAVPAGERTTLARRVWQTPRVAMVVPEQVAYEPFADGRCDIQAGGRVAFAPERERWLVSIREQSSSGINLERPWQPVTRTPAAIARAMDDYTVEHSSEVFAHEPAIGRVRWRPDGLLWVEPGANAPTDGVVASFDELTAGGALLRRVRLIAPNASPDDRLIVMEDGRFVLLRGFSSSADEAESVSMPEAVLLEI